MMSEVRSFVVPPSGGRLLRGPVGGPTILKATVDETAGTLTVLETEVAPLQGPPLHLHRREDEFWYILAGDFRFRADDRILTAPQGSFVFVPRGTRHCFQNVGSAIGRVLVGFTPGGMERFFEAHAELPPGPVDPEVYRAIADRSFMVVAGPPLAEESV
jgi:mannose-6-phosphate isomerase-like protein (cupin superfamily)